MWRLESICTLSVGRRNCSRAYSFSYASMHVWSSSVSPLRNPRPYLSGILNAIEAERKTARPGSFEEARYEGKRVFQFTRGDRADTGDEHTLFSEDGKEIRKFGGFVGHVTFGNCSINRITFVRAF